MKANTTEIKEKETKSKDKVSRYPVKPAKAENKRAFDLPPLTPEQRKIQLETFKDWQDWTDESMDVYESYLTSE
jgi:hypothetical protein